MQTFKEASECKMSFNYRISHKKRTGDFVVQQVVLSRMIAV